MIWNKKKKYKYKVYSSAAASAYYENLFSFREISNKV